MSHPSRVRGLKYQVLVVFHHLIHVAPLAGAWIEITIEHDLGKDVYVAPLAGAWIEISRTFLKPSMASVAPLAGAWIEITNSTFRFSTHSCRTPRGCVD